MLDHGLSPQQLAVICALSCGANMAAAAQQAGVHRNTITNWRRNLLPFQRALADAQYDKALYFREKVEDLVELAIKSIHEILTDPKASPSVKLRAALAILTTASTPPDPRKQVELNIEKVLVPEDQPARNPPAGHKDAQTGPADTASIMHNNAQPTPPKICVNKRSFAANPLDPGKQVELNIEKVVVTEDQRAAKHNNAQPMPSTIRINPRPFAANPPARNAQCPCGSGKKYKRCCIAQSSEHAA